LISAEDRVVNVAVSGTTQRTMGFGNNSMRHTDTQSYIRYLPSYGGYVRYVVGILITVVVGRQAIKSFNYYLEKQKLVEQLPEVQRREELSYDTALTRPAKEVCPGCERGVDLKHPENDFCPHCGIGLFDHCGVCSTRKSAFSKLCHVCGAKGDSGSKARLEAARVASA